MSGKSTFARWREEMGLSLQEAGELLGLSRAQVCVLNRGVDPNGNPAVPRRSTLLLMQAVASGVPLRPWALTPEETAEMKAKTRRRIEGARRRIEEAA